MCAPLWISRKLTRLGFVVTVLATLACGTSLSKMMSSWVGQSESRLLQVWGAPDRQAELSDGGRVLSWVTVSTSGGRVVTCRQSFTVDDKGIVRSWSYNNCPKRVRGK